MTTPSAVILETYLGVATDVPPEIADDFDAVLAGLQGRPLPTVAPDPATTDPVTPDPVARPIRSTHRCYRQRTTGSTRGASTATSPSQRLNDYVNFVCRDSDNNPGPAATQPLDDITPATSGG